MKSIIETLSEELSVKAEYAQNIVNLLDEGNTVPFIARYRKEMHGAMDDQTIRNLADRLEYLRGLETRKGEVKNSIENQGKLTEELAQKIDEAATLAEVEDLYRPYKQKRRTRATVAKEKGLEPLAVLLFAQEKDCPVPEEEAVKYIDPEKGVESKEDALAGASDIIAELISDDAEIRKDLKSLWREQASVVSRAATEEDTVYRNYYEFSALVKKIQGHQVLAINRGEREEKLKAGVEMNRDTAIAVVTGHAVKSPACASSAFVRAAAEDAYDRLIAPSVEREIRAELTETASEGAIGQFALNLRPLLMQPPVKGFVTMGLDPGYRMGCKVAIVDSTGKVLDTTVVYPTYGEKQKQECIRTLSALIAKDKVRHIAIGNGTASRETEQMTCELISTMTGDKVSYAIVNEAGASVYSASPLAAKEFPDYDVNLRSAVSIARRLQDPLAELVKIDPKSIGVGQYQHDVNQNKLKESLDHVVETCVNSVGINVNTASRQLLSYVSGIGPTLAANIVKYRTENGPFNTRSELMNVPRMGEKAFQQCAGFLRIPDAKNPLDNTAVHPERYALVEQMASDVNADVERLTRDRNLLHKIELDKYITKETGLPTLTDIILELEKPGRDPRETVEETVYDDDVRKIADLHIGQELNGKVNNITAFGVFVDLGMKENGLIHISQLSDKFISSPSDVVSIGQRVKVKVIDIDVNRGRIALTMKGVIQS